MKLKLNAVVFFAMISAYAFAADPKPNDSKVADKDTTLLAEKTTLQDLTTIIGRWKTIDDKTGKEKSIVEIKEVDGQYVGHVVQLFRPPTEEQNPLCDKCKGELKDKPILGIQVLSQLKKTSESKWSEGDILDPNNGKVYSCKMELIDGGKKLEVRGFIGISLLGRTQTWIRAE